MPKKSKPEPASRARILVGPAGWSYADWNGIVYPQRRPRGFHEAVYLAQFFDTIEINTSFYQPLRHHYPQLEIIADEPSAEPTLFPIPPRE
jgi:hypothetical protein